VKVGALVLAAGSSQRMGTQNKLLAEVGGKAIISRVLSTVSLAGIEPVILVTGHESQSVQSAVQGFPLQLVHNDEYQHGLSSSLQCGLKALPENVSAVIVVLGDMPLLTVQQVESLLVVHSRDADKRAIVVPVREGRRGNPVLWPRYYWPDILELEGDSGAKTLMAKYPQNVVEVPSVEDGSFIDIDTPEMLKTVSDWFEKPVAKEN